MKDVLYTVEDEGLDYAMCNYSDWSDIKDTKFHELRNTFLNTYRDWETDRKSTRLNSSHSGESRMPSSA